MKLATVQRSTRGGRWKEGKGRKNENNAYFMDFRKSK